MAKGILPMTWLSPSSSGLRWTGYSPQHPSKTFTGSSMSRGNSTSLGTQSQPSASTAKLWAAKDPGSSILTIPPASWERRCISQEMMLTLPRGELCSRLSGSRGGCRLGLGAEGLNGGGCG